MTVNQWGIIGISSMVAIAFLGSLTIHAHENGHFKKLTTFGKKNINSILIVTIAFSFLASFIWGFFYNVTFGEKGNSAYFGQTGDFFGGIMNPTVALISLILLLLTYRLTLKTSQLEHARVEREEVRNVINDTKATLDDLTAKKDFMLVLADDKQGVSQTIYFSINDSSNNQISDRGYCVKALVFTRMAVVDLSLLNTPNEDLKTHELTQEALTRNVYYLGNLRGRIQPRSA